MLALEVTIGPFVAVVPFRMPPPPSGLELVYFLIVVVF